MEWIAIINIVLPKVIDYLKTRGGETNPATGKPWTYSEVLAEAGSTLDAEDLRLLADIAADMAEGAT